MLTVIFVHLEENVKIDKLHTLAETVEQNVVMTEQNSPSNSTLYLQLQVELQSIILHIFAY